jgi:formylmethanofuran dehydrogenase subunit A
LVHNKANVLELEENVAAFEYFLKITVAELGDQINLVKIIERLRFGDENFNHSNNVGVPAIFQQHNFPQDTSCLGSRLK